MNGEGTVKEDVKAYAWLNLAASRGVGVAKTSIEILTSRMSYKQITEARKLAETWAQELS